LNKIRQTKSRQNLVQRVEQHLSPVLDNSTLEAVKLEELADRVSQALAQIPTEQHQVLELSYYGGLSQSAITDQLNIPLGTVKTRSRQGLLKLRQLLQDLVQ
jgi:RNA polymerase sigma-70 factor (ECF subfamily)